MKVLYPTPEAVTVWVGSFTSEGQFDYCIDRIIAPRLKLPVEMSSICEVTWEEQQQSMTDLLEGFSGCESFSPAAVLAAESKGIRTANAALICYYLRCEDAPDEWGDMTLLGTFSGTDVKT